MARVRHGEKRAPNHPDCGYIIAMAVLLSLMFDTLCNPLIGDRTVL
jgi:hypothetical protein